jgi:hypothetical protein
MPTIGQMSPQQCADCTSLMYWALDAGVREDDGRDYPGYRCTNGHVSAPCRVCGSRDTTRLGAGPFRGRRILHCGACGKLAAFNIAEISVAPTISLPSWPMPHRKTSGSLVEPSKPVRLFRGALLRSFAVVGRTFRPAPQRHW